MNKELKKRILKTAALVVLCSLFLKLPELLPDTMAFHIICVAAAGLILYLTLSILTAPPVGDEGKHEGKRVQDMEDKDWRMPINEGNDCDCCVKDGYQKTNTEGNSQIR